jgi:ABC-type branched-subunit amino acid transport system ATPase component
MTTTVEAPTTAPVLAAENITVRFGGLVALSEVRLEVPANTMVGLIGPNGAGKSTLLGVLSGLIRPQSGRVFLESAEVTGEPVHKRARRGLARTFQQVELFAGLTVGEHLMIAWRNRFHPARQWRDFLDGRAWRGPDPNEWARVDYLLGRLGLQEVSDEPVTGLPLGLCRLVEVGRALASSPKIVLLDEPFSGLDSAESEQLAATLTDLMASEKVAFLLVDHDVNTVLSRASRVIAVDAGRVIAAGTPAQIRADQQVRTAYLGDDVGEGLE